MRRSAEMTAQMPCRQSRVRILMDGWMVWTFGQREAAASVPPLALRYSAYLTGGRLAWSLLMNEASWLQKAGNEASCGCHTRFYEWHAKPVSTTVIRFKNPIPVVVWGSSRFFPVDGGQTIPSDSGYSGLEWARTGVQSSHQHFVFASIA